jgi:hypothetical protein
MKQFWDYMEMVGNETTEKAKTVAENLYKKIRSGKTVGDCVDFLHGEIKTFGTTPVGALSAILKEYYIYMKKEYGKDLFQKGMKENTLIPAKVLENLETKLGIKRGKMSLNTVYNSQKSNIDIDDIVNMEDSDED